MMVVKIQLHFQKSFHTLLSIQLLLVYDIHEILSNTNDELTT